MELKLIDNHPDYYEFIRNIRLDPENIDGFINQNNFTYKDQEEYMKKYGGFYKICLCDETPVGFVGVINDDIRVATKPEFKNRGIGKFMINEMIKEFPNSFAKIKLNNHHSIKLFESCGFKKKYIIMEHENTKTNK